MSSHPLLIISSDFHASQVSLIDCHSWVIGRSQDCEITIADRSASRHHARIVATDQRTFWLSDLSSLNGTYINGQRVSSPVQLQHGDRIMLGRTELRFHYRAALTTQVAIVLMIQSQPRQARLWEEILNTQGLSVVNLPLLEDDSDMISQLQHWFSKLQQPPNLLLLDINTTKQHPRMICDWCQGVKPPLRVILTDATRTSISNIEREQAIAEGACELLPALPETELVYHLPKIRQHVSSVLQVMESQLLEEDAFASALLCLEAEATEEIQPTASLGEYFQ